MQRDKSSGRLLRDKSTGRVDRIALDKSMKKTKTVSNIRDAIKDSSNSNSNYNKENVKEKTLSKTKSVSNVNRSNKYL